MLPSPKVEVEFSFSCQLQPRSCISCSRTEIDPWRCQRQCPENKGAVFTRDAFNRPRCSSICNLYLSPRCAHNVPLSMCNHNILKMHYLLFQCFCSIMFSSLVFCAALKCRRLIQNFCHFGCELLLTEWRLCFCFECSVIYLPHSSVCCFIALFLRPQSTRKWFWTLMFKPGGHETGHKFQAFVIIGLRATQLLTSKPNCLEFGHLVRYVSSLLV